MAIITVSLAYADGSHQYHQKIQVPLGTTLHQAIISSGWLHDLPSLSAFALWCNENLTCNPNHKAWYVGIYSQKKRLDTPLSDGDRIEIYRPLSSDPMSRRKNLSTKNPSRRNKHQTTI